jgi:hypothetical protein
LLKNDRVAEVAPVACGVNVTVKEADWPAFSIAGSEIPETTNSAFVRLPDVTVTAAPLAVRLPVRDELAPTTTLPKLRLVGETANWPGAVPVPDSAMLSGEFVALETIDKVPLAAAALVGAKITVNVTLWPAVSVVGTFNPLIENNVLVAFACEIVTDDPPVFVSVSDKLALLLT